MAKVSQRQVIAEITPVGGGPRFDGFFAQVSGGEITAQVEKVYDGGALFPDTLCAVPEVADVTVTRHFDPDRDGGAVRALRQMVGNARYDVKVYVTNCDLRAAGSDRVYAAALLTGLTEPDGDSSSSAASTFSLTFSIGAVAA